MRDDFCLGDIMIYDLKGFSIQHLLKFQLALAKKMIVAAEVIKPLFYEQPIIIEILFRELCQPGSSKYI